MSINWVTQRKASDALGVSESTLQKWRNKDKILEIGVSPLWSKERINSFFTDIETN